MRIQRTIRSFLAAAFLALFALAITPKIAIHAMVAHHIDTHQSLNYGESDQFNKLGFHCPTDNLVVEFQFLQYSLTMQLRLWPETPVYRPVKLAQPLTAAHPLFGLRGPPAFLPSC
jgi:hypothetical protein